jgi:hypothetical protein
MRTTKARQPPQIRMYLTLSIDGLWLTSDGFGAKGDRGWASGVGLRRSNSPEIPGPKVIRNASARRTLHKLLGLTAMRQGPTGPESGLELMLLAVFFVRERPAEPVRIRRSANRSRT